MLQEADDKYFETVESVLSLTKRASQIFESSNSEAKSLLINMVLLNLTVDNEIVRYEAKNPFNKILEFAESSAWGGFLSKFRTALQDSSNYIPKYPEFEKVLTF